MTLPRTSHSPDATAMSAGMPIDLEHPLYARLLKALKHLVCVCDKQGSAISMSQTWVDYTGVARDQLLGAGWAEVVHPDDRAMAWGKWGEAHRLDKSVAIELRIKAARDDQYHWWMCRGLAEKDAHGEIVQWVWMCTDIDAQKCAAKKALVDEEHIRLILQRAPLAGFRTDLDSRITTVSGKGLSFLQRTGETFVGRRLLQMAQTVPPLLKAFKAALDGQRVTLDISLRAQDWQVFLAPELDVWGVQTGVVGVAVLVTERNRLARLAVTERAAREASQLKAQFLANMSHEVRTPLAGVLGVAELLRDLSLSEEQLRYVEMIQTSGQGLLHVINDILSFSQAQMTSGPRPLSSFAPRRMLLNQVEMMRSLAMRKGLKVEIRVDDGVPDTVLGDVGRVNQVLLNLLSNAIKFTHVGSIELSVAPHGDKNQRFGIRDSGIGLDLQTRERLFKPFAQASNKIAGQYGGSGLGLSISRDLVVQMGGSIGVDSVLGEGSTFWFTLPVEPPAQGLDKAVFVPSSQTATQRGPSTSVGDGAAPKALVLIVEDNRTNQVLLSRQLAKLGLGYAIANHGEEALEMLRTQHFDLILMDCQMPTMDGYQATQHIRAGEVATQMHTPVVAVTANVLEADQQRCRQAGMDDYLAKPFNRQELTAMLTKWLPQGMRQPSA